ncbi:hypothetical protein FOZ61_009956 [Perkinsus olseni]|uniref:Uncharacterized protein n=1 Tax=Perkinsus olseni TaxID=32597 RepID=A0A7J6KXR2_PEROL|nr:hypothetical protein FOZ61_009956 [Perkinsus olseni]
MPPQSPRRSRRLQAATGSADRPDNDDEEQQQQREGHPESSATASTKEVSMTVAESNKLREKLGLRKLTTNDNNDAPEGSSEKPKLLVDEHDDDAEGYDAKAAIRKRRDKRIHEQLVSGTTLGEASSTVESAADWVERSNNNNIQSFTRADDVLPSLLNEGASAASAAAAAPPPPPPSKKHRKGSSPSRANDEGVADVRLKVAHNVEDLREGETILTMKDKPILACGTEEEEDSDDDEIVLEEAGGPQGLAQKEKEDIWRKEKRRSAWDPTLHWDDNEDEENGGGGDGILDKYTTVEERAAADARRRGFTLAVSSSTQNGEQTLRPELTQDVEARLKELTEENKRRAMMQSVSGGNIHIQSDVMDTNEAAKFIKRRNKEARKAMRRRTSKLREEDNKDEAGWDIIIPPPKRTMGSTNDAGDDDDDDLQDAEEDQELYRQLERQKMVEQKVKARSLVKEELVEGSEGPAATASGDADGIIDLDTGASYVQSHLGAEVKDEKMEGGDDDDDDDHLQQQGGKNDDNGGGGGGGGRMSRASEFCASIQTPVELKQAQKDEEFTAQRAYRESRRRMLKGAARRGVELAAESSGGKQSEKASSTTSEHRDDDDDDDMELSSNATGEADRVGGRAEAEEEDEAPDHDFEARDEAMQDQKVDDGAACAIRYFVERGMMSGDQDSFNSYDPGKRPMTSEEAELRIDHRDEFGRVQSAKEAFR